MMGKLKITNSINYTSVISAITPGYLKVYIDVRHGPDSRLCTIQSKRVYIWLSVLPAFTKSLRNDKISRFKKPDRRYSNVLWIKHHFEELDTTLLRMIIGEEFGGDVFVAKNVKMRIETEVGPTYHFGR